jgi:hypothetical protein
MSLVNFLRPGTISTLSPRLMSRAGSRLRQWVCGLHGHEPLMHFEKNRVALRCICGYETPGWEVTTADGSRSPVQSAPRVVRLPVTPERRVA